MTGVRHSSVSQYVGDFVFGIKTASAGFIGVRACASLKEELKMTSSYTTNKLN